MFVLDVNILVYAHREDLPQHALCKTFIEQLRFGNEPFGVPEIAFSGLVRIVTQPAFSPPSTTAEALNFCAAVQASTNCKRLLPGPTHWAAFDKLCRQIHARGKLVADAYLAAFALDRNAEWVTLDRDFGKFPVLRWRHPGDSHPTINPA